MIMFRKDGMMIACPQCKKSGDLISEQPYWERNDTDDELIRVQSHCINCTIDFETVHKISDSVDSEVTRRGKSYQFSLA